MRILKIAEEAIGFDNGSTIVCEHEQDCCENVYVDWSYLKQYNVHPATGEVTCIYDIDFDEDITSIVEREKDMGIKLVAKDGSKWFIPCYNEQNGYYSDNLTLTFNVMGKPSTGIDISECTEFVFC